MLFRFGIAFCLICLFRGGLRPASQNSITPSVVRQFVCAYLYYLTGVSYLCCGFSRVPFQCSRDGRVIWGYVRGVSTLHGFQRIA